MATPRTVQLSTKMVSHLKEKPTRGEADPSPRASHLQLRTNRANPDFFQAGSRKAEKRPKEQSNVQKGMKRKRGRPKSGMTGKLGRRQMTDSDTDEDAPKKGKKARWRFELFVIEEGDDIPFENEAMFGRVVWAQFGSQHTYHPAIVIKGSLVNLATNDITQAFVYWFSDTKVSSVPRENLLDFVTYFKERAALCRNKADQQGLLGAIEEIRRQAEFGGHAVRKMDLLRWAHSGFPTLDNASSEALRPHPADFCFPEKLLERLSAVGREIREKVAERDREKNRDVQKNVCKDNALKAVWSGEKALKDVCISCAESDKKVEFSHPLFHGGLCEQCKDLVKENAYAVGNDGSHSYCAVCASGGQLFVCDTPDCGKVYCLDCVEELAGEEILKKLQEAETWSCFLCETFQQDTHGLLKAHPDWQRRLVLFFDLGHKTTTVVPDMAYFRERRPIRVLSLFDGIATGLVALKQAGFEVGAYYTSEVDEQAIIVALANHGFQVTQLGDITKITSETLERVVPIDLLIGGSPCNELSLANPKRKGFDVEGSGVLFFDFYRVLRELQTANGNTHLFWMFENVTSMPTAFRDVICRFLKCQPALWDAKHLSAQKRSRFFWGNIPGLYSTPDVSEVLRRSTDLNTVLTAQCDRQARVPCLRTVTTQPNSLLQGPGQRTLPITMGGTGDTVWMRELERLFGFPDHYTDVGNFTVTKRRALLGRSWSVQVVKEILRPLKQYFAATSTNPDHCQVSQQRPSASTSTCNMVEDGRDLEPTTSSHNQSGERKPSATIGSHSDAGDRDLTDTTTSHNDVGERDPTNTTSSHNDVGERDSTNTTNSNNDVGERDPTNTTNSNNDVGERDPTDTTTSHNDEGERDPTDTTTSHNDVGERDPTDTTSSHNEATEGDPMATTNSHNDVGEKVLTDTTNSHNDVGERDPTNTTNSNNDVGERDPTNTTNSNNDVGERDLTNTTTSHIDVGEKDPTNTTTSHNDVGEKVLTNTTTSHNDVGERNPTDTTINHNDVGVRDPTDTYTSHNDVGERDPTATTTSHNVGEMDPTATTTNHNDVGERDPMATTTNHNDVGERDPMATINSHNDVGERDPMATTTNHNDVGERNPMATINSHNDVGERDPMATTTTNHNDVGERDPMATTTNHNDGGERDPMATTTNHNDVGERDPMATINSHNDVGERDPMATINSHNDVGERDPMATTTNHNEMRERDSMANTCSHNDVGERDPMDTTTNHNEMRERDLMANTCSHNDVGEKGSQTTSNHAVAFGAGSPTRFTMDSGEDEMDQSEITTTSSNGAERGLVSSTASKRSVFRGSTGNTERDSDTLENMQQHPDTLENVQQYPDTLENVQQHPDTLQIVQQNPDTLENVQQQMTLATSSKTCRSNDTAVSVTRELSDQQKTDEVAAGRDILGTSTHDLDSADKGASDTLTVTLPQLDLGEGIVGDSENKFDFDFTFDTDVEHQETHKCVENLINSIAEDSVSNMCTNTVTSNQNKNAANHNTNGAAMAAHANISPLLFITMDDGFYISESGGKDIDMIQGSDEDDDDQFLVVGLHNKTYGRNDEDEETVSHNLHSPSSMTRVSPSTCNDGQEFSSRDGYLDVERLPMLRPATQIEEDTVKLIPTNSNNTAESSPVHLTRGTMRHIVSLPHSRPLTFTKMCIVGDVINAPPLPTSLRSYGRSHEAGQSEAGTICSHGLLSAPSTIHVRPSTSSELHSRPSTFTSLPKEVDVVMTSPVPSPSRNDEQGHEDGQAATGNRCSQSLNTAPSTSRNCLSSSSDRQELHSHLKEEDATVAAPATDLSRNYELSHEDEQTTSGNCYSQRQSSTLDTSRVSPSIFSDGQECHSRKERNTVVAIPVPGPSRNYGRSDENRQPTPRPVQSGFIRIRGDKREDLVMTTSFPDSSQHYPVRHSVQPGFVRIRGDKRPGKIVRTTPVPSPSRNNGRSDEGRQAAPHSIRTGFTSIRRDEREGQLIVLTCLPGPSTSGGPSTNRNLGGRTKKTPVCSPCGLSCGDGQTPSGKSCTRGLCSTSSTSHASPRTSSDGQELHSHPKMVTRFEKHRGQSMGSAEKIPDPCPPTSSLNKNLQMRDSQTHSNSTAEKEGGGTGATKTWSGRLRAKKTSASTEGCEKPGASHKRKGTDVSGPPPKHPSPATTEQQRHGHSQGRARTAKGPATSSRKGSNRQ